MIPEIIPANTEKRKEYNDIICAPPFRHQEGTEKHTIFILTLIKKEKNHQSFYDSGGFFVRRNINCLFFRRKFLFFIH